MTPKLSDRLTRLIPMLGLGAADGEILTAARLIEKTLGSEGLDLCDLANRLCSEQPHPTPCSGFDASGFANWAADFARRDAEREARERAAEAERVRRAEIYAAEKAAKAAARAAERATSEFKARVAQRRRDAVARRAAERAVEAERVETERRRQERIVANGPRWDDLSDAERWGWVRKILRDPLAQLDPPATAALDALESALTPQPTRAMRRGRKQKPNLERKTIAPESIALFEKAARDHALRTMRGAK